MYIGRTFSFILIITFCSEIGYSQLIEIPYHQTVNNINQRIKADTIPIDLPFWDDFSTSVTVPDTAYWVSGNAIFVNPGIGINPPSFNVATFDGWDAFGNAYNSAAEATGKIDSLISRPINLGKVPGPLQNTVFLSFYYERLGNGDVPNKADSLILQFKREDDSWETVWPLPGEPISTVSNFFSQKILQVSPEYMYNGFQFKFQAYGRQNGPFDTWNLDYVYLDKRRDINDLSYLDRTFTTVPTSIIGPYSSVPIDHFFKDPDSFLTESSVDFINLERQVQPVEYSVITKNKISGSSIDTLILDSAFLALRFPLGQLTLQSGKLNPLKLDSNADSIVLETTFYMDSGDDFLIDSISSTTLDTTRYQSVDLRVNDTTTVTTVLSDYYAYDDGTAEFGAGINQLNGRLAYMFVSNTPGYITSIDINFLNIGRVVAGTPISLFVLDSLVENIPIEETTPATAQVLEGLDQFLTYTLINPIAVTDTFYIGYQQSTSDFLGIGLDKNTDTKDRIFLNVSGTWQKDSLVKGSLMMRPRFGENIITGINNISEQPIKIYPNPSSGILQLPLDTEEVFVYDIKGVKMSFVGTDGYLDISHLPPSIYLMKLRINNKWSTHRVILER